MTDLINVRPKLSASPTARLRLQCRAFWMGDRAVDCARLESVCAERHRGFESPPIRPASRLRFAGSDTRLREAGRPPKLERRGAPLCTTFILLRACPRDVSAMWERPMI